MTNKGGEMTVEFMQRLHNRLGPSAAKAIDVLEGAGYQAYVVGGFVRDAVLDRPCHDVDITTDSLWYNTRDCFIQAGMRVVDTGSAHGTVTVLIDGEPIEITTFRTDGTYSDHRRPDSVRFVKTVEEDLSRRDFTVNAMAWNPRRGFVDPFGGLQDLHAGVIRCVGEPARRFEEDALRILRAVRFSAQLGFAVDSQTASAIEAQANSLRDIACERRAQEYDKLVCGAHAVQALRAFPRVAWKVVPHIKQMVGFDQQSRWHCYDVWEHCLHALELLPADAPGVLRHATLLHDIGKPPTFTMGEDGHGHFYGHEEAGAKIVVEDLGRLRWRSDDLRLIEYLVRYHDRPIEPTARGVRRALARASTSLNVDADGARRAFTLMLQLKRADTLSHAPRAVAKRLREIEAVEAVFAEELARGAAFCLADLAVKGGDLIAIGVQPGPQMGYILKRLLREVVEGITPNEADALLGRAQLLK